MDSSRSPLRPAYDKFLSFYCPSDARQKKRKTGLSALQEFIGYHGDQSMVEIGKLDFQMPARKKQVSGFMRIITDNK